jgi:large subunit ribosomal protein L9
MKLILKENFERLGRMGDLVEVADGYARNFLLPRKIGVAATAHNVRELTHVKQLISLRVKQEKSAAEGVAQKISALSLSIPVHVGEQDKLYGSVTAKDIAEAIAAQGMDVDKRNIVLERPIKELGVFMVPVRVHHDVVAQVKVEVVRAESDRLPEAPESLEPDAVG